jgi:hypothetical protein
MVEQFHGAVLDRAVSLSAALKPSLWQRHRRAKKPSTCERFCGVSISDKSAPQKYGDNASCIMMSKNPANRERIRHVDTRMHYLRELVRDGHVKLLKCAGPQNVADALTKSLPRPALAKHRQYMWGTRIPFSAFYLSLKTGRPPTASYNIITPCGYQVARAA